MEEFPTCECVWLVIVSVNSYKPSHCTVTLLGSICTTKRLNFCNKHEPFSLTGVIPKLPEDMKYV